MKKLILVALVFCCFSFTSLPVNKSLIEDQATIYIYQSGQFANKGNGWLMFLDQNKICTPGNNSYIKLTVNKGRHTISLKNNTVHSFKDPKTVTIDTEAGQSYYIACNSSKDYKRVKFEIKQVAKSIADQQMKSKAAQECR